MSLRTPTVRERILLHLMDWSRFAGAFDLPPEVTQQGIAQAAWIREQHVVQYVRPLITEALVRERVAHVFGGQRRRKVYELTDPGRLRAFALRDELKATTVRARDDAATREATLGEIWRASGGRPFLDIVREVVHTGFVDLRARPVPAAKATVKFLGDAPAVEEFVGRRRELDAIVGEGAAPRVIVVRGVAGIGKSTLAAKACEMLGTTHHLFWHRVRPWDTPPSLLAALGSFLAALGRPSLKAALSEGQESAAFSILQADVASLRAFLVLDDVHEATNALLPFLRFLKETVARAREVRLVVLARRSVRFYDRRDVDLTAQVRELDLRGLDEQDARALIPPDVAKDSSAQLAGHPLFLRLLRSAPPGPARNHALRSVDRFIEEAIYGDMTERERRILKLASLYRVPVPEEALLPDPSVSRGDLRALAERTLITPVGAGNIEVHDTLRSFFVRMLTDGERMELGRFATHQLTSLADRARSSGLVASAIQYLFNALEAAPTTEETFGVAETLGDVQEQLGDLKGSEASYRKSREATPESGPRARLHRKLASVLILTGAYPDASAEIERGFRDTSPAAQADRGWLHLTQCRLSIRREEWEEAIENGTMALDLFQTAGDVPGQGQALYQLAHAEANWPRGSASEAERYLDRAVGLAETIGDPRFLATVRSEFAYLCAYRLGEGETALEHLAAVEAALDPQEVSYGRASFLMLKGLVQLQMRAEFAKGEEAFRDALGVAERLRSTVTLAYARFSLAQSDFYQGRFDAARSALEPLVEDFRSMGALPSAIDATCALAECCLLLGDVEAFDRLLDGLTRELFPRGGEVRPNTTNSLEALRQFLKGNRAAALAILEATRKGAEETFMTDAWFPHFATALVMQALGEPAGAAAHREVALSTLRVHSFRAELESLPLRERLVLSVLRKVAAPNQRRSLQAT